MSSRTVDAPGPRPSLPPRGGRIRLWISLVAIWAVVATIAAAHAAIRAWLQGNQLPLSSALLRQLPFWIPLFALAPAGVSFVRRFPFDRTRLGRSFLLHGLAAITLGCSYLVLAAVGSLLVTERRLTPSAIAGEAWGLYLWSFHFYLLVVGGLLASAYASENHRRLRVRDQQAVQLSAQLWESRLSRLRAQLHPHFLFNTLNSISCLVDENTVKAREMIAALGDLLRHSLRDSSGPEVELGRELASAQLYLQIENIRFEDRLVIRTEIAPEAQAALVPSLILQPVVENAVRHGIARTQDAGLLELKAAVVEDRLVIEVANDGARPEGRPPAHDGERIGLGNTRERLRLLYGQQASLTLEPLDPGGARVIISMPFRTRRGENAA